MINFNKSWENSEGKLEKFWKIKEKPIGKWFFIEKFWEICWKSLKRKRKVSFRVKICWKQKILSENSIKLVENNRKLLKS